MNRLHPLSAVTMALQRGLTGFSVPVFLVGMGSSLFDVDIDLLFVLAPIGLVAGIGYGIAYYYRFTYEATPDTFDVTSGVFPPVSRNTVPPYPERRHLAGRVPADSRTRRRLGRDRRWR